MLEWHAPSGTRRLPLLDADPDLGQLLAADRRATAARGLLVPVQDLTAGRFDPARISPAHLGLLLLGGVVAREVVLNGHVSTELLGPGDVVIPWTMEEPADLLPRAVRWSMLASGDVALLDRRLAIELCAYPEIYAVIMDRLSQRAARLATTQAISQLTRVDRRIVALFWHLAERWGRMTADGVHVPLRLSHRLIGQIVSARRPTVSAAATQLSRDRELIRRADGTWFLPGEPRIMPLAPGEPFQRLPDLAR
jgi:CRP/FNR family transcriptional regulator, cyclic AMP receptor protein